MKQLAALIVALIVTALARYGIEVPAEVQAALNELLTFIGGALAALAGVKSMQLARGSTDSSGIPPGESGRAQPWMLSVLAILSATVMALHLTACSIAPDAPRQAIAAGFVAVESLAEAAEIAYRDGHIDADQRSVIKTDLQAALDALTEARRIESTGGDASGRLEYARAVLLAIQKLLPHEEPVR